MITQERYEEICRSLLKTIPENDYTAMLFGGKSDGGGEPRVHGAPMQDIVEILWLLKRVKENIEEYGPITSAMELGTCDGGGLKIWEQIMPQNKDSLLISVDYRYHILWDHKNSPVNVKVVTGDTHHYYTREQVKAALNGRKLDFLFIDAYHTAADTEQDFIDYGGLVAPNRIIAFHDTRMIRSFWDRITGNSVDVVSENQPEEKYVFYKEEYKNSLGTGIFHNLPNQNVVKFKE